MSKETLISELRTNGKMGYSWLELAKIHDIKVGYSDEQRAKAANDIWRSETKRCQLLEEQIEHLVQLRNKESLEDYAERVSANIDRDLAREHDLIITAPAGTHSFFPSGTVIGGTKEQVEKAVKAYEIERTWHETKDTATLTVVSPDECKNPDELISSCGIDTDKWEVDSFWQSNKSNKWNISCNFKKKKIDQDLNLQKKLILDELKSASLPFASFKTSIDARASKDRNHLLEISLFDLHIGKLGWAEEVGEDYDSS